MVAPTSWSKCVTSKGGCWSPECLCLILYCCALLAKSKLKLCRKQVLETVFNIGEHFKLAKSFSAARGGNPTPACSFQPLPFVYTSAIHVVMQKNPCLGIDRYLFCQVSCNRDQFPKQSQEHFFWLN